MHDCYIIIHDSIIYSNSIRMMHFCVVENKAFIGMALKSFFFIDTKKLLLVEF